MRRKPLKRTPLRRRSKKRKKQVDDDTEFYQRIWDSRDHHCEECVKLKGKGMTSYLGEVPRRHFFSHILTKGAHPALRRVALNISLVCFDHHQQWEFGDRKSMRMYEEYMKRIDELYKIEQTT